MTDVGEFFDRFDAMKPSPAETGIRGLAVSDDELRRAARAMMPLYARASERAGVDLGDLADVMLARTVLIGRVVVNRAQTGASLLGEIHAALANVCVECFLAGVVFEQEKHLPDLGATS